MKIITKQSLDELIKNLETAEKPVKEIYTRKEAIEALKPTIKELKKRGFSLAEIAQVISEQSNKELRINRNELKEICEVRKRQVNNVSLTQPSPVADSDKDVSETVENGTTLDEREINEIQVTDEAETE